MTNETTVKVTADASGYTSELDKARASAQSFAQSQEQAAARVEAAQQAISEAAVNGSSASARAINSFMSSLTRAADTAGKTRAELLAMRAAQLGVSDSAGKYIQQIAEASTKTDAFSLASHGAQRELMVLAHELATGNFKRAAGSMMVLGERTGGLADALGLIVSPIGIMAAVMGTMAIAAYQGAEAFKQFNASIQLTGNYAGITADGFYSMADAIASTTHSGLGDTEGVLRSLAASGQYTSDEMRDLSRVIMDTAQISGKSLEDVQKEYEGLAKDPAKWAEAHVESMHMMDTATLESIQAMQKAGDQHAALAAVIDAALSQVQDSSEQHIGAASQAWASFKQIIDSTWQSISRRASGHSTIGDQIEQLQELRSQVSVSPEALTGIDDEIAALERQRRQMQQNADEMSAYQQKQTAGIAAEKEVDRERDQLATNAERRAKELAALAQQKSAIEAAGGSMPDYDQLVARTNDKYKDKPNSQQQNVLGSELADERGRNQLIEAEEQRHVEALKAARSVGLVDMEEYLSQLHAIQASALDQEIANQAQIVELAKQKKSLSAEKEANNEYQKLVAERKAIDDQYTQSLYAAQQARADAIAKFGAAQQKQVQAQGLKYTDEDTTRYMQPTQKTDYTQQEQLYQNYMQALQTLREKYEFTPDADQQEYTAELQQLSDTYNQQETMLTQHLDQEQQIRDSYSDQMHSALTSLSGDGRTNAQAVADGFTTAWQSASNALDEFITTGKGNFDSFTAGILADLAKIALQQAEKQMFSDITDALFPSTGAMSTLGGIGSTMTSGSSGYTPDFGINSWGLHLATGGHISGPGSGTSDSVPAMLSNGEYVVNAASTSKYRGVLESINNGTMSHFATGGAVGSVSSAASSSSSGSSPVSVTVNNHGGGSLSDSDAKQLHQMVQSFVDQRMRYQMTRQGGYASQIRYGQI